MTVLTLTPPPAAREAPAGDCAECGLPCHLPDLTPTLACDTYGEDGLLCPQDLDAHIKGCRDCRLDEYAYAERMDEDPPW